MHDYSKEILQQVLAGSGADGSAGQACWMSWGAHNAAGVGCCDDYRAALKFNVQGFNFTGRVTIELTWMDVYKVRFREHGKTEDAKVIDEVYCDELTYWLDKVIEHTSDYEKRVDSFLEGKPLDS